MHATSIAASAPDAIANRSLLRLPCRARVRYVDARDRDKESRGPAAAAQGSKRAVTENVSQVSTGAWARDAASFGDLPRQSIRSRAAGSDCVK